MKFTIDQSQLLINLNFVGSIVNGSHPIPIYNSILIKAEKISRNGLEFESINIDNQGTIPTNKKCCIIDKFIFLTPINFGDMITSDLKVIGETTYEFKNKAHQVWIAQNLEKQDTLIIDKETGLVFSDSHKETGITVKWEKTELTDTNIFEKKYLTNEVVIPKWFKTIITYFWIF